MSHIEAQLGMQIRSIFDRLFPHRQIIHRSCGAVRGVRLSPGRQAFVSLGGVILAGWCVLASADTLFAVPRPAAVVSFESERAKYQRWLGDLDGRAAAAQALLADNELDFAQTQRDLEMRHTALRALLEYANGSQLQPHSEPDVTFAMMGAEPTVRAEENARVRLVSLRLETVLGPPSAAAAPLASSGPTTPDFVSSVNDPEVAARVQAVSERVDALRRLAR